MSPPTRYFLIFVSASARLEKVGTNSCPTLSATLIFATRPGIQASGAGVRGAPGAVERADGVRPPFPPSPPPQPAAPPASRTAAASAREREART
ncbi:hypothetical protein GCM10010187_19440 [Actinomadura coerulea]|nr:hypothetical protein GCM10010187_19440 [Actinomadura coerulea]